ncbi:hypothetical protein TD95_001661, partial [Thielaviopsis punctulata]
HGVARTVRIRTDEQRQQDLVKIEKYRQLDQEVQARAKSSDFSPETFELSTRLLRLNPEYYTIWNVRRRCIISHSLSALSPGSCCLMASRSSSQTPTTSLSTADSSKQSCHETPCSPKCPPTGKPGTTAEDDAKISAPTASQTQDLQVLKNELLFTIPLLMEFPKCYWIWDHRVWALEQTITRLPAQMARAVWEEELGLDSKMLMRDRRNFHAWGYRQKLTARLESAQLGGTSMAESEFEYTTRMIQSDLSNFSAWHRRAMLIPRILSERKTNESGRKSFFEGEMELVHNALNVGPEDQSLWYYHQFLMLSIVSTDPKKSFLPNASLEYRCKIIDEESEFINDLLEDYDDVKWIYEALLEYAPYKQRIEGRSLTDEEKSTIGDLVCKLEKLDPMRNGRWKDVRKTYGL